MRACAYACAHAQRERRGDHCDGNSEHCSYVCGWGDSCTHLSARCTHTPSNNGRFACNCGHRARDDGPTRDWGCNECGAGHGTRDCNPCAEGQYRLGLAPRFGPNPNPKNACLKQDRCTGTPTYVGCFVNGGADDSGTSIVPRITGERGRLCCARCCLPPRARSRALPPGCSTVSFGKKENAGRRGPSPS